MYDGEIRIDSRIDSSGIDKGLQEIEGKLNHSIKGLQSLMSKVKGAAAFAALSKAVYEVSASAEALENSLRKASTLFGDVSVNVDNLRGRILKLSSDTGIAAEQIGDALYEALSSGVPVTEDMGEAMEFLRSSAEAAKGGFADLSGTVTATAAVINAYGMSMEEAERVQGVLMQTQNKGMTTIGQLSTSLARVIPTAASFGVSLEQVGAALATSTAAGTQTAEAVTGLNAILSELGKQGQQAADNLAAASEAAGQGRKTFQELTAEGYDLSEILTMMEDYAEGSGLSLIDMFGSVEAGRTALQLAGENAERFGSNLESMYDTAGLVASAAAKVTTNTERLGTAIRNAGSTIGGIFEPAVQDAAGWLADMINSLTGNKDEANNLRIAFADVKTALDSYREAQEKAKTATDETTEAMLRQNGQALRRALQESADAYSDAMARLNDLEIHAGWDWLNQPPEIKQAQDAVDSIRDNMQEIFSKALGEVDFEEGYRKFIEMPDLFSASQLSDLEEMDDLLSSAESTLDSLKAEAADLGKVIDDTRLAALQAYEEGMMSLSEIGGISKDLAAWVLEADKAYQKGKATAAAYGEITEENAGSARDYITALNEELLSVEYGTAEYVELETTIKALTEAYNELAKATGKPLIGVQEPQQQGSSPKSPAPASIGFDASSIRTASDVMGEFYERVRDNGAMAKVMGKDFDEVGGNIEAVRSALTELITDFDLGENNEDVKALVGYLKELETQTADSSTALQKMGAELAAWAENAAKGFAQSLGSGFETLISDFLTIDEQVEALNEELDAAQEEQKDRYQDLADARSEYQEALLLGNEEEIEAAREQLEMAERQAEASDEKVKALKNEIKATESGEEAWASFGKAALTALADVLEGLGAQLAAQAVAKMISWDWANAAIATAGSIAAYAAAGLVRGWAGKYAEGGIVPKVAGVPDTGDQHIAAVNPGELILTKAQQENLAGLLTAQEAMLAYREAEGRRETRQLTVEISGDVYGLDSEEVGRAIYRNISSLQTEGVIGRWN